MTRPVSRFVCAGCGAEPAANALPFRCPNAVDGDDVDHVLRRELDLAHVHFPEDDSEPNPFVRYRTLLHAYHVALDGGMSDGEFCDLVRELDEQVAELDGHGFAVTPFERSGALSDKLGFSSAGGVWVKDETGNVSGSHKARHLFGVLVFLEVLERLGRAAGRPDLAIASCGNAALAAAVVARAAGRTLRVFVPVDADPVVLDRLRELDALVTACPRVEGVTGDPTVHRLREAIAGGALPFTCQGNLNGLAVEGGETLGWEMVSTGVIIDRLMVQVGGGALASAVTAGLREGSMTPRLDTVQTEGAWPLRRAYTAVVAHGGETALHYAARHRHEFMRPWEQEPHSIAHGILDDETYDWLAVVEGMLRSHGSPLVVGERVLLGANALARTTTGIPVDPTGSAGLAGLIALRELGAVDDDETVALLFTGIDRSTKGVRDAELHRTRHPVAQGIRAS
ncbi:MAG: pyridoxal-phosphate dependent enzyme [Gaiellaceae bacterium]